MKMLLPPVFVAILYFQCSVILSEDVISGSLRDAKIEALGKINFDEVIADIKNVLVTSKDFWPADYGNYGPLFIRLAWHSSGSYRIYDGRGGSDGGRQRFDPERSWADNTNLDKARSLLIPIKQKYGIGLSWGDLIVLAGNTAIESMGGPVLGFCGGRIDEMDGSESIQLGPSAEQNSYAPCLEDGKCQAPLGATTMGLIYVNPEGPMGKPIPNESANDVRDTFARMAMDDIETVALIGGGHAFGKTHGPCPNGPGKSPKEDPKNPWPGMCKSGKGDDTFTSGFEFPWTTKPTQWDNEYFQNLVNYEWHPHLGPGGHFQWSVNSSTSDTPSIPHAPSAGGSSKQPIGMLTSDISLLNDPKGSYQKIVNHWAKDQGAFENAFSNAWYKLSTRDMGPHSRCVGTNVPPAQAWQYPLPDPLKNLANFDDVKTDLREFLELEESSLGKFVRLAWQCSSTFRITDYLGGCNGARIRFSPQKDWSVNKNLEETLKLLEPVKEKYGTGLSWADLIIVAGNTAIENSSNVKVDFCPGRTDADDGEGATYLKPLISGNADDNGVLLRESIKLSGLSLYEYIALYGAGYAIGDVSDCEGLYCKRNSHVASSHKPSNELSNIFFKTIVSEEVWEEHEASGKLLFKAKGKDLYMFKVDLEFKYDPELASIAQEYAASNDLFVSQFMKAWKKISTMDRFDGPYGNLCTKRSGSDQPSHKLPINPHKSEL